MRKIKKIDIHAHTTAFSQYYPRNIQKIASPEEVIDFYDKLNIEKGCFFH